MKKQILYAALCMLMASCALSSCGSNKKESSVSESQSTSAVGSTSSSDGFDWDIVKQDITRDGNKIDFPCSANDLGKDYIMSKINDDLFGENMCYGSVDKPGEYTNTMICMVYFYGVKADDYNSSVKCSSIAFAPTLYVQGIGEGSSMEDAEKVFGKPYDTNEVANYYLSKSGKERITIYYDEETNKVEQIQIKCSVK